MLNIKLTWFFQCHAKLSYSVLANKPRGERKRLNRAFRIVRLLLQPVALRSNGHGKLGIDITRHNQSSVVCSKDKNTRVLKVFEQCSG